MVYNVLYFFSWLKWISEAASNNKLCQRLLLQLQIRIIFSGSSHLVCFSSIIVLHVFDLNLIFWALWWSLLAGLKRSCWNYSVRRLQTKQLDLREEIFFINIAQTWHFSCTFVLTHISNDGTFNSFSFLLTNIIALFFHVLYFFIFTVYFLLEVCDYVKLELIATFGNGLILFLNMVISVLIHIRWSCLNWTCNIFIFHLLRIVVFG